MRKTISPAKFFDELREAFLKYIEDGRAPEALIVKRNLIALVSQQLRDLSPVFFGDLVNCHRPTVMVRFRFKSIAEAIDKKVDNDINLLCRDRVVKGVVRVHKKSTPNRPDCFSGARHYVPTKGR